MVRNAYRKNLRKTQAYQVDIKGEQTSDRGTLVMTEAKNRADKSQAPVQIDYLMHSVGGVWKVRDLVTEGSSLVASYRSQFGKVIKSKGMDGLLEKLRKKAGG